MTQSLIIKRPVVEHQGDWIKISTQILVGDETETLWYRVKTHELTSSVSPFVAASLLVGMKLGLPVQSESSFSPKLAASFPMLQDIFQCWDNKLQVVPVEANYVPEVAPLNRKVAAFFSGGLDSFYTFLKHREEIDILIFILGFDIPLDQVDLRDKVITNVRQAAHAVGKELIEIETNVRTYGLKYLRGDWGKLYHGSALASVGLALAPSISKIYIPATRNYSALFPLGSHPLVDPLWSTESVEFVHDGCEANRITKAVLVAPHEVALQILRVCWRNPEGAYNCGRCEKCIRTMLNLYAVGALDKCPTFQEPLTVKLVKSIHIEPDQHDLRAYAEDNLRALEAKNLNLELQAALRGILRPSFLQKLEYFLKARLGLLH